jgi:hypothetical protein
LQQLLHILTIPDKILESFQKHNLILESYFFKNNL